MKVWIYKSPIGAIYIKQQPDGSFGMEHDGTVWEACDTPQAEADNVYMQSTGCADWDMYELSDEELAKVPKSLNKWQELL